MNEKPLERLNYYNGQRLEATDLKLEQEYHIRVRRWLNKSLYSAGIARGLEVHGEPPNAPGVLNVVVRPGLALDAEGREIILLEEERINVLAKHNLVGASDVGFYLTIQYREQTLAEDQQCCVPRKGDSHSGALAWGGPARLRAKPILGWSDVLPHDSSGKIVLGRVVLNQGCSAIERVQTDVRQYVGVGSAARVHQYALEGERHIDKNNPGQLYFHIKGRQPNAVTLCLRAARFSTLFYTEMGRHDHGLTVGAGIETGAPVLHPEAGNPDKYKHWHPLSPAAIVGDESSHIHTSLEVTFAGARSNDNDGRLGVGFSGWQDTPVYADILPVLSAPQGRIAGWDLNATHPPQRGAPFVAKVGGASTHSHTLTGKTDSSSVTDDHTHLVNPTASMGQAGVTDPAYSARGGDGQHPPNPVSNPILPLTYVDDLQVWIGKPGHLVNQTENIKSQLAAAQPNENWSRLGNGTAQHVLKDKGTGEIKLDFLPDLDFEEGEYCIELSVDSGGGRVLFNLYVE